MSHITSFPLKKRKRFFNFLMKFQHVKFSNNYFNEKEIFSLNMHIKESQKDAQSMTGIDQAIFRHFIQF